MVFGTEAECRSAIDPATFDSNLSALTVAQPETARRFRAARPPAPLERADAEDGGTTFRWRDAEGRIRWLGRTTMPSIRAQALAEAFIDGGCNALIDGIGAGDEARRLLGRLLPHQAVFVLDKHPWQAAAALRRIDVAKFILGGRLLIFVGDDDWEQLQSFLIHHPGYVEPQRVLAWPFWEPPDVAAVQDSLRGIHDVVGRARHEVRSALSDLLEAPRPASATKSLAVVTAATDRPSLRTVRVLEAAAQSAGWRALGVAPDGPASCHPCGVESRLVEAAPTHCVLVNQIRRELTCRLPKAATATIWTRTALPPDGFLDDAKGVDRAGVRTAAQRVRLVERGVAEDRIRVLPPAAQVGLADLSSPEARQIMVIGDAPPSEAEDVGLHLPTHARLWRAARETIASGPDRYLDDDAEAILRKATDHVKIRIEEQSVAEGLASRVRRYLLPGVVQRSFVKALVDAGIEFDLYGDGWEAVDGMESRFCGPTPAGAAWRKALGRCGLAVFPGTSGEVCDEMMDAAAAGLAVAVRRHPVDATPDGLTAVLNPSEDIWHFDSRKGLVELAREFLKRPGSFVDRAGATSAMINERHTWDRRLKSLWPDA
jgi:hypothetical protein